MGSVSAFTSCLHCGTPLLENTTKDANSGFCCAGCSFVYGLLNRKGLGAYYQLKERSVRLTERSAATRTRKSEANLEIAPKGEMKNASTGHPETYAYCDDPVFLSQASADGRELDFYLDGMSCTACVWLLEKLPDVCDDAENSRANLGASRLRVRRKPNGSFAHIAQTLERLGYRPYPIADHEDRRRAEALDDRRDLIRIGVAGFGTGNIMIHAVSLYAGAEGSLATGFRWFSALLALPVLTYAAWPFYRSAFAALRARTLNIDVPIVAALLAGVVVSAAGLWSGTERLYFDSLSMLVFLLLSSRYWLKRVRRSHLDATDLERQILTGTIRRQTAAGFESISVMSIQTGDLLELEAGQTVPADGRIEEGHALVQTAVLTGEAAPQSRHLGEQLDAGCKVVEGRCLLRVAAPPHDSRLAKILKEAENASRTKPRLLEHAERTARIFVATVFIVAFGVFAAFVATDPSEGVQRALALVIVTCPCVFGMAIPLSLSLAVRRAAQHGIIIKDPDIMERLSRIRIVAFDKTGTLTEGNLQVRSMNVVNTDPSHLAAAYALEEHQSHPIARALREALRPYAMASIEAPQDVRITPASGLEGRVAGRDYQIRSIGLVGDTDQDEIRAASELLCDGQLIARFEIGDRLKAHARQTIAELHRRGIETVLFSGDHEETVALTGRRLGLSEAQSCARMTPESKAQRLSEMGEAGLMVGDGANDAGALAAASVGVAVHGAMDVSLRAADAYLINTDLAGVIRLLDMAQLTRTAIRRNLMISASFNIIAGFLAVAGWMAPLWAAVLMPLSSLSVLLSSLATGRRMGRLP